MAMTIDTRRRASSKFKRAESLEYRLIFICAFAAFLVATTIERLLPTAWLRRERGPRKSILENSKAAANTIAAYAFMG